METNTWPRRAGLNKNSKGRKMTRHLKTLGAALAVVFAMSAVVASAASAQQGKLTINGGTSVTLDATETGLNAFTLFGARVECPSSTMKIHKITTTPHQAIPANATEGTLTPTFINCATVDALGTHKVTVTMTSCDFHSKIGQTTGGVANTYGVNAGITCTTPGDTIDVEVYAFAGSELGGIQCTVKIKAQNDLTGAHITTDTANDDININGTITGIHAERSGGGCATETTTVGQMHINVTVKGTDTSGSNTGITVTD